MSNRNTDDGSRRLTRDASERAAISASERSSPLFNELKGAQWYKVKEAHEVIVSIIPYRLKYPTKYNDVGGYDYTKEYYVHNNLGNDGDNRALCYKGTFGEECGACNFADKLARSPNHSTRNAAAEIKKTKKRNLYRFLIKGKEDEGLFVFDSSYYCFQKLLEARLVSERGRASGWGSFAELDTEGFDLALTFTEETMGGGGKGAKPAKGGKGGSGKFFKVSSIDFLPRKRPIDPAWLKAAPNLDKLLKHETLEEQEARMASLGAPKKEEAHDDEDSDDDAPPVKRSSRPAASEDEDDDYPQPPKKKKRPAADDDDE